VAARMRTSTESVCSPPMRSNFWLCSTRSSLIWAVWRYLADLVRKTCRRGPAQSGGAAPRCPVKAPSRAEELAFEQRAWIGRAIDHHEGLFRGAVLVIARATAPWPVPLSPGLSSASSGHVSIRLVDQLQSWGPCRHPAELGRRLDAGPQIPDSSSCSTAGARLRKSDSGSTRSPRALRHAGAFLRQPMTMAPSSSCCDERQHCQLTGGLHYRMAEERRQLVLFDEADPMQAASAARVV